MKLTALFVSVLPLALALLASYCGREGAAPDQDATLTVEQRIDDLLSRLTLEEKVGMVSGLTWMDSRPVPRLGIPALKMNDGPLGVRYWDSDTTCLLYTSDAADEL